MQHAITNVTGIILIFSACSIPSNHQPTSTDPIISIPILFNQSQESIDQYFKTEPGQFSYQGLVFYDYLDCGICYRNGYPAIIAVPINQPYSPTKPKNLMKQFGFNPQTDPDITTYGFKYHNIQNIHAAFTITGDQIESITFTKLPTSGQNRKP